MYCDTSHAHTFGRHMDNLVLYQRRLSAEATESMSYCTYAMRHSRTVRPAIAIAPGQQPRLVRHNLQKATQTSNVVHLERTPDALENHTPVNNK